MWHWDNSNQETSFPDSEELATKSHECLHIFSVGMTSYQIFSDNIPSYAKIIRFVCIKLFLITNLSSVPFLKMQI